MEQLEAQKLTERMAREGGLKVGREAYAQYGDPLFRAQMIGDFLRAGKHKIFGLRVGVIVILVLLVGLSFVALLLI